MHGIAGELDGMGEEWAVNCLDTRLPRQENIGYLLMFLGHQAAILFSWLCNSYFSFSYRSVLSHQGDAGWVTE